MSPRSDAYIWDLSVKIDGSEWSHFERADVKQFVWRDSINEPPTGRLVVTHDFRRDPPLKAEESIGKVVEVVLKPPGASDFEGEEGAVKFRGEVHEAEHTMLEGGTGEWVLVFRHKAHRLTQRAGCKMWQSMDHGDVKHSDICSSVISEAGLSADVESSQVTRNAALQYRETDFNFLLRLAEDMGCWLVLPHDEEGKVKITKSANGAGSLGDFDMQEWSVAAATTPNALTLLSPPSPKNSRVGANEEAVTVKDTPGEKAYGELKVTDFDVGLADTGNTKAAAESLLFSLCGDALSLEGTVFGRCLFAGDEIEVPESAVGDSTGLAVKYFITDAEVEATPEGVQTKFSGHMSSKDILPSRKALRPRIDGVVVAVVTQSESDIDDIGRIRVKFPWADSDESAWARIVHDWAGNKRGSFYVPHVDDEVLVAFEHGDPNQPVILGSLYNSKDVPPLDLPSEWTKTIIKTEVEHALTFEDKDGSEFVEINTGKELHKVRLDDANRYVEILSGGGHSLKLDDQGRKIELKSAGGAEMVMDDNSQSISIKVGGCSIKMEPAGITIKATQVQVKGDAKASVEGAMTEVKGSGMVKVQGGMTMIN